jgi:hypothetical protein
MCIGGFKKPYIEQDYAGVAYSVQRFLDDRVSIPGRGDGLFF